MARIALHIQDPADRYTLKTVLEAEGHQIVEETPEVWIVDSARRALDYASKCPTLVLTPAAAIAEAVEAMRLGVYGYLFRPIQPGEAGIMVARALQQDRSAPVLVAADAAEARKEPTLAEVEREHILRVLRQARNNHSAAARALGIGRNTLWRKLKQYGIQ